MFGIVRLSSGLVASPVSIRTRICISVYYKLLYRGSQSITMVDRMYGVIAFTVIFFAGSIVFNASKWYNLPYNTLISYGLIFVIVEFNHSLGL